MFQNPYSCFENNQQANLPPLIAPVSQPVTVQEFDAQFDSLLANDSAFGSSLAAAPLNAVPPQIPPRRELPNVAPVGDLLMFDQLNFQNTADQLKLQNTAG